MRDGVISVMARSASARARACLLFTLPFVLLASPARAQFQPRPIGDPATGERYHVEAAAGFWFPTAEMSIASQALGQPATLIDFKKDLGLTDQRFREIRLEARGGRSKFRFQYIPITYQQSGTLSRDVIFNGQRFRVGLPVNSTLDWKAYRIGYEYDFIRRDRGFAGFIFEFKYTDVTATLQAPPSTSEFTQARAPIPAIGLNFRAYVVPNISITGEVTGFKLPDTLFENIRGHYVDVDVYGTLNFTNYVGVQAGYRSLDVGYVVDTDSGSFLLKGIYLRLVARY